VDLRSGQKTFGPVTLAGWGQSLAFSPDGRRLAIGLGATEQAVAGVSLLDLGSGEEMFVFDLDAQTVPAVSFASDGSRLAAAVNQASVPKGSSVFVWDASGSVDYSASRPAQTLPADSR
jgi:dipeptidyl aminopeptidase/acylaminoacyl peptidase